MFWEGRDGPGFGDLFGRSCRLGWFISDCLLFNARAGDLLQIQTYGIVFVHASTVPLVYTFAVCLGIGFGGGVVCLMAVLGNYYGLKAFALLCGIAIAVNTTLSAIAPWVAGRLFERGYGYQGICYFLAAWCFVGALVLFLIRKPVPPSARKPV